MENLVCSIGSIVIVLLMCVVGLIVVYGRLKDRIDTAVALLESKDRYVHIRINGIHSCMDDADERLIEGIKKLEESIDSTNSNLRYEHDWLLKMEDYLKVKRSSKKITEYVKK